jgi:hypothetical protein
VRISRATATFAILRPRRFAIRSNFSRSGPDPVVIGSDLSSLSDVRVLDLAPDRNDGYDLTDWLLDEERSEVGVAMSETIAIIGETRYGRR